MRSDRRSAGRLTLPSSPTRAHAHKSKKSNHTNCILPYFLYTRYKICRKYSQYKLNFSICVGVKSFLCNPICESTLFVTCLIVNPGSASALSYSFCVKQCRIVLEQEAHLLNCKDSFQSIQLNNNLERE
jgi:hypothetical protein